MSAVPLALIGMGKMGRALAGLAPERGFRVVAELDPAHPGYAGVTRDALAGAAVAIDFTTPDAAAENARACARAGCPVVVGTTGWYDQLEPVIAEVRKLEGSMFWAPNFSVGIAVLTAAIEAATLALRDVPGFDAHLVETHHAAKKDKPSGTAAALANVAKAGLSRDVPITSVRTGFVPGTHELVIDAAFEQLRLVHEARDRRVFADGAISAAEWLQGRKGVFTMRDVLHLKEEAR